MPEVSGGRIYLVGGGSILFGAHQNGGKTRQFSTPASAFSAVVCISLKCVL